MAYSEEISREHPSAFLFLIDQSLSMNKPFTHNPAGKPIKRAAYVANAVNKTLEELVSRCLRDDGVRNYFEIGVIGYGKPGKPTFCWEGALSGRGMVPIAEVAANANLVEQEIETKVRDEVITETVTVSQWVKPGAYDATPMKKAFLLAHAALEQWIAKHGSSFPPIVINITDGMANDVNSEEELLIAAQKVTNLKTTDGNVLMFNCHIDSDGKQPVVFPSVEGDLPDDPYARLLFKMSSEMSDRQRAVICELLERDVFSTKSLRGMAYNADAVALVRLLDIGTQQAVALPQDALGLDGDDDMMDDDDDMMSDGDDDWADDSDEEPAKKEEPAKEEAAADDDDDDWDL